MVGRRQQTFGDVGCLRQCWVTGRVLALIFDTHKAVKTLEEAGFGETEAEAIVEMLSGAVGENAATKADPQALEHRMTINLSALVFGGSGLVIALVKLIP